MFEQVTALLFLAACFIAGYGIGRTNGEIQALRRWDKREDSARR